MFSVVHWQKSNNNDFYFRPKRMSVIVSLGIDVFNGKIDDFGKKRCQYQVTKKKNPKKGSKMETQE